MLRAASITYCMSALPSSSGGVPTAMNCSAPVRHGAVDVGRELQPARGSIAADHRLEAGFVDRHAAAVQHVDLGRIDVEAQNVVADLGQAGARDQADIARADHRDFHARDPIAALIAASTATGSAACVIGRPTTR